MKKISVALATYNEEKNIGVALESVEDLADEIVVVDGSSEDNTVNIAESYGAKVVQVQNDPMFHNMKQKAFDLASGDWVLYLDADERVTPALAREIKRVVNMEAMEMEEYQLRLNNKKIFLRHQKLLEKRDGNIGISDGEYTAFFFPRLNYFLGRYLRYGGVYPDGVIRLFKKGTAYLPCKDVHEQMIVKGKVGWLDHDLLHISDPTFERYIKRNSRYIDLMARQMAVDKLGKDPVNFLGYFLIKPISWFLLTQIRHKGILDGVQGIIFSFFSALRFPRAYWRYINK